MKLIVGLGNPGREYTGSRHNIGFRVIKSLADNYDIKNTVHKHHAIMGKGIIEAKKVILAQPTTFMNRSGKSVINILNYYKIDNEDLIVIYDDLDLPVGKIRIKKKGSSGGHRGIQSVVDYLQTENFPRIRIGIGQPGENMDVRDYVLGKFTLSEEKIIKNAVSDAVDSIREIFIAGFQSAMNKYN